MQQGQSINFNSSAIETTLHRHREYGSLKNARTCDYKYMYVYRKMHVRASQNSRTCIILNIKYRMLYSRLYSFIPPRKRTA